MATLEEIVVQLTAETSQLRSEMQNATKTVQASTDKMADAVDKLSENSSKSTGFMQQAFATMTGFLGSQAVLGVFGLVKDGVGFLTDQLIDAGQEAMRDEQAFNLMAASLAQSGKYSKVAADGLVDFANEMEGIAQTSSDVIANNIALLSSMTKLDAEGLKKAEMSAINLSAAFGKDLSTATNIVGLAINGQEKGLKKLGIELNLTSDKAANLKMITEALAGASGSAQARMNTFAGVLFSLKDAWGDMFKEVAKAITQNDVVIAVLKAVGEVFSGFTKQLKEGGSAVRDGIGEALIELLGTLQSLMSGISSFVKYGIAAFSTMATGVSTLYNGFMALGFALDGNKEKAAAYFDKIVESANSTNKAWEAAGQENALDKAAAKIGELKNVAVTAYDEMKGKTIESVSAQATLQNAIQKTSALTQEQADIIKSFATGLASQGMALNAQFQFANTALQESLAQRMALTEGDYAAQLTAQTEFFSAQQALRDGQYQVENDALLQARANNLVTEQQFQAAKLQLQNQYAADNLKAQTAITQFNAAQEKQRAENFKGTMGTIATLSESGNKELAAIGKAAAITNATIDGYAAIQKALASAPPPFNFALAAAVGIATAANVAKISGTPLASGITSVPRSAGGGNGGDNFPAILSPGERVVDSETNQDLKAFLARAGDAQGNTYIFNISNNIPMAREAAQQLLDAMRDAVDSGALSPFARRT